MDHSHLSSTRKRSAEAFSAHFEVLNNRVHREIERATVAADVESGPVRDRGEGRVPEVFADAFGVDVHLPAVALVFADSRDECGRIGRVVVLEEPLEWLLLQIEVHPLVSARAGKPVLADEIRVLLVPEAVLAALRRAVVGSAYFVVFEVERAGALADELVRVGEVETKTNDYDSVADDFEKLTNVDATAVWLVPGIETGNLIIRILSNRDLIPPVSECDRASDLCDEIAQREISGLSELETYRRIHSQLDL